MSFEALLAANGYYRYFKLRIVLEIRTVSGVYLIAMKMITYRDYRNDISDAIGILIEEETEAGNRFSYDDIETAYKKLYHEVPDTKTQEQFRDLCAKSIEELKALYHSQKAAEFLVGEHLNSYIGDSVKINTKNVTDVAAQIREKMNENQ